VNFLRHAFGAGACMTVEANLHPRATISPENGEVLMDLQGHWERVYQTKRTDEVSWFRPHLETSLDLIRQTRVGLDAAIVDVGGGASTLVDDLLDAGYRDVTIVDLSSAALDAARARLASRASAVTWIAGDATRAALPAHHFRVWHDRAVFHFLTDPSDRDRYVAQVGRVVTAGGHVIVATFGPEGPQRCSGLPTARYGADALHAAFGDDFELVAHREETHETPSGIAQQFVYCL
jgi:SAM-dependent methyltransferase